MTIIKKIYNETFIFKYTKQKGQYSWEICIKYICNVSEYRDTFYILPAKIRNRERKHHPCFTSTPTCITYLHTISWLHMLYKSGRDRSGGMHIAWPKQYKLSIIPHILKMFLIFKQVWTRSSLQSTHVTHDNHMITKKWKRNQITVLLFAVTADRQSKRLQLFWREIVLCRIKVIWEERYSDKVNQKDINYS